jgi:beta-aspartyl-peptidase (threonine type)
MRVGALSILLILVLAGCSGEPDGLTRQPGGDATPGPGGWAIAVQAGAGTIPRDMPEERVRLYLERLELALRTGVAVLESGGTSLDAVEQVLRQIEDDPLFNAGRGAVFNHDGGHELDASVMDGSSLACGAVAGVHTVKNPISLARLVMEQSPHVLLSGDGAERFADETGVERVDQEYFFTERRWRALQEALERGTAPPATGTAGATALDRHGNLAAGTSTGGLTNKWAGRIGDSPIVGAGTYADNRSCAISATGKGEEFIRNSAAYAISALMRERGISLRKAAEIVIHETLAPGDGGVVGVSHDGSIAMVFSTVGMYRAAADSTGRFEVRIWE